MKKTYITTILSALLVIAFIQTPDSHANDTDLTKLKSPSPMIVPKCIPLLIKCLRLLVESVRCIKTSATPKLL